MFKTLFKGFHFLVSKPFLVLVSMIFLLLTSSVTFLLADYWINLILFFILPPSGFSFEVIPFYLIARYPLELIAVSFIILVSLISFNWLFNSIAISLINETPSVKATIESVKHWQKHLGIAFFYFIFGLLYFIAFFLLVWISSQPGLSILFLILLILIFGFGLIGLVILFKILFTPIALVFESNGKKAIKKSWRFASNHFVTGVALFFIVFLIYFIIAQIGLILSDLVANELVSNLVFLLINAIGLTYALVTLTEFFNRKQKIVF